VSHLERIVAATREEVQRRRHRVPVEGLIKLAQARAKAGELRPFSQAISAPGLSLIAEHKRRSPSAGTIRQGASVREVVQAYERGGAAALSILTEEPSFGGSLDDLREARAASALPILRKDFTVDSYQLPEAVAAGADAILLIVAALGQPELRELHARALELGLAVLVEAHNERELHRALDSGAQLVGINSRDLRTLEVATERTLELIEHVPAGVPAVAESGFSTPAELGELEQAGFAAVLVGEALMRSADIEAACLVLTRPTM
jgi:indole-3-glycerol phosphate synthase